VVSNISDLKVKLFYIASLIAILGHSIDAFFVETNRNIINLNLLTIILLVLIFLLFHFSLISNKLANSVVVYSVLFNSLISIVLKTQLVTIETDFFLSALTYGVLVVYAGFALKRFHIFILAFIYILFYLVAAFYSNSYILFINMPIILILLGCFLVGMNAIVKILNNYHDEQLIYISNMQEANQLLEEKGIELKKLNATKDKLFSILGHDLRTPANTIMGFAELIALKAETTNSETIKEYSNLIYQSSNSLNSLIGELLDWARLQTGNNTVNFQSTKINSLIKDAIELMHGTIYLKNINVLFSESSVLEIDADKQMLATVVRNLLNNALKYTPKNGNIAIQSKIANEQYLFTIKDSGIGMDKLTLTNLFTDITIQSKPGTEFERGTGLGLVICRGYIKLHNGKIWAESEIDQGSTFSFSIPMNSKNK